MGECEVEDVLDVPEMLTTCMLNMFFFLRVCVCTFIHVRVASKFGYGSAHGDPDVRIGLDHLRFGMDRGYGSGLYTTTVVEGSTTRIWISPTASTWIDHCETQHGIQESYQAVPVEHSQRCKIRNQPQTNEA